MTIEKLERVMWRLRSNAKSSKKPTNHELRRAIMVEVGTDERTYKKNRKALIYMGWIKTYNRKRIILTNIDITEV